MVYFIKYIGHLLTASNQHGVHSPFVYDYVTKCLYSKKKLSKKKSVNILLKSMGYFKVETLLLPSEAKELVKTTVQAFPELQLGILPYDLIYAEASNLKNIEKLALEEEKIHNNTLVLVDNIHKTEAGESAWEQFKNHKEVTVTIDLFYCAIVFFRKEQAKEHFKIRI